MKKIIRKVPGFNYLNAKRKFWDFNKEKSFYWNNYMYSKNQTKNKMEYELILEVHKIEKGLASMNPRPFGIDKIKKIINLLLDFQKKNYKNCYASNLSYSILEEYIRFNEEMNWFNYEGYIIAKKFMSENTQRYNKIQVGASEFYKSDFINNAKINYDSFLSSRKSIRNYSSKKLSGQDIEKAVKMAIKTPSACNRQMIKVYYIENNNSKKVVEDYAQGLGLFDLSNANYFIITFDTNANYFIGEKNQGWFNAGLFSMNFVNALHSLEIGSCFVQFGNSFDEEKKVKNKLNIPVNERIAVIVVAGYYDNISKITYSSRKKLEDVYFIR